MAAAPPPDPVSVRIGFAVAAVANSPMFETVLTMGHRPSWPASFSNLGAEVLLASTLGLVLVSLGTSLSLATLLVVNVGVTFFAALIPVPGGIGVTEGALVVGLTAAGLDQATAFAAAICYRLCTYYLPPIWGWFGSGAWRRPGCSERPCTRTWAQSRPRRMSRPLTIV